MFRRPVVALLLSLILTLPTLYVPANAHDVRRSYSLKQQVAAVDALQSTLLALDGLDRGLSKACHGGTSDGQGRSRHRHPASGGKRLDSVAHSRETIRQKGREVLQRLAGYEPLISACAVESRTLHTLFILSTRVQELLRHRGVATQNEEGEWLRIGGARGSARLRRVAVLDCVTVREVFSHTILPLKDAETDVNTVEAERPVGRRRCSG